MSMMHLLLILHCRLVLYIKVALRHREKHDLKVVSERYMLEIATGKLFPPTKSPVKQVDIEINVDVVKPTIY